MINPNYLENVVKDYLTTQSQLLTTLKKKALENTEGKGENAGNQHFLLFPQCFLLCLRENLSFYQRLILRLQMLSIWSCPKFFRLVELINQLINITH